VRTARTGLASPAASGRSGRPSGSAHSSSSGGGANVAAMLEAVQARLAQAHVDAKAAVAAAVAPFLTKLADIRARAAAVDATIGTAPDPARAQPP
jgi:hypothetical protein